MSFNKVPTTLEIFNAIYKEYDLSVHSSYTNVTGKCPVGNGRPEIKTQWAIKGQEEPIIGTRTTWDLPPHDKIHERDNEKTEWWLCIAVEDV